MPLFNCKHCGMSLQMQPHEFPLHCQCGYVYTDFHSGTPPKNRKPRPRQDNKEREENLLSALPCIHRGKKASTLDCDICGSRGMVFTVFDCGVFEKCTLARVKQSSRGAPEVCLTCSKRQEPPQVTACITTFNRPRSLNRLLESIGNTVPVVVHGTQGNLSSGRNYLVESVNSEFILLLEDDFEFTSETSIDKLLDVLRSDSTVAGVGGTLLNPDRRSTWAGCFEEFRGKLLCHASRHERLRAEAGTEYVHCNLMWNFGLFRRDVLREFKWDEELPVGEHIEWFYRVWKSGKWRFAVARGVEIRHHKDRPTDEYARMRKRNFRNIARQKMGISYDPQHPEYAWGPQRDQIAEISVAVYSFVVDPRRIVRQLSEIGIHSHAANGAATGDSLLLIIGDSDPPWISQWHRQTIKIAVQDLPRLLAMCY